MTRNKAIKKLPLPSDKALNIFAFSLIGVFALFLLRGAFYGVATPDESFYLTIPYRVILGDALLVDEWHASQLSAFLLYLPMKLFIGITGGTDGIVLFFRCLFVLCQTAVSLFTYVRFKKYGIIPALISGLLFLTYVTEQVHMLDYYTMTLMGFQVTSLLLFTYDKQSTARLIFTGIVFACTVTAQPFNSLIYFLYTAVVIFFVIKNRKHREGAEKSPLLSLRVWLFITAGILLTAIVFMAFMLSQASLSEILANFGNLFGGQDHNLPFSAEADSDMFSYFTIVKTLFSFTPVCYILSLLVIIAIIADKKRISHRKVLLIAAISVTTVYYIVLLISCFRNMSAMLFRPYPLFILTISLILLKKERNYRLLAISLSGIFYIIFLGIVSQALNYVGAIGFVLSNTALMPAAMELYREMKEETASPKVSKDKKSRFSRYIIPLAASLCICCILTGGAIEFINDPAAASMGKQQGKAEEVLTSGPLKGIITDKKMQSEYLDILSDLKKIDKNTDSRVLIAGLIPWTYFCFDAPPAAFTTWYIANEMYMYEKYYEDEEHIPQCIYIPDSSFYWGYDNKATANRYKLFFRNMFSVTNENGEAGTIFYVKNLR